MYHKSKITIPEAKKVDKPKKVENKEKPEDPKIEKKADKK